PLTAGLQVARRPAHWIVRPDRDVLDLTAAVIVLGEVAAEAARVHDLRIVTADGDVATLTTTHRIPVGGRDSGIVRPTRHAQGVDVLLRAVDAIRNLIVGHHVIELRRRLVVLGGP